jgi:hypothetical protein
VTDTLWGAPVIADGPALPSALGFSLLEIRSEPPLSPAPLFEGKAGRSGPQVFSSLGKGRCPQGSPSPVSREGCSGKVHVLQVCLGGKFLHFLWHTCQILVQGLTHAGSSAS